MTLARRHLAYSSSSGGSQGSGSDVSSSMSDDDTRGSRSRITCDTSRINVLIEELELRFDSAKAGRYDDAAKLACISTMTDSEVIKKLVRGWMKFGIPIGGGRKVAWRHATWREGVDALRLHFPPEDTEQEAATELSCYKQNQRLDPHVFEWMHLREAAGDVIDPESQNKLINDSFIQTLPTAEADIRYKVLWIGEIGKHKGIGETKVLRNFLTNF